MSKENKLTKEVKTEDLRENLRQEGTLSDSFHHDLLKDLNLLQSIKFNSNIFGIGNFITTVLFDENEAIITTKLADQIIKKNKVNKEKFLKKLQKIDLGHWKRYYPSNILDGTIWNLSLSFKDDPEVIKTGGNSDYPDNFKKLKKLLKVGKLNFPKIKF